MSDDSNIYESWVLGLRKWQNDPSHDLSVLPALANDTFTPETYARLFAHLTKAISVMMGTWNDSLQRAFHNASSEFDLARELVALRSQLARRMELATLPNLPIEISKPLEEGARRDILRIQEEIEQNVMAPSGGAVSSRAAGERMLQVVRTNRLTTILEPNYNRLAPPPEAPAAAPDRGFSPISPNGPEPGVVRRRVFLDPQ